MSFIGQEMLVDFLATGAAFTNQPGGASYTMAGDDIPYFLVHLDHQSRQMKLEAFYAVTNKNMHLISLDTYLPRNSTATGFFNWAWDGTTFKKGGTPAPVPNGTYVVKLSLLKALGDANNAADWETWTSPAVTIARRKARAFFFLGPELSSRRRATRPASRWRSARSPLPAPSGSRIGTPRPSASGSR